MTTNDMPDQEIERRLQVYFAAEAARLRAPADLWARIEDKLARAASPEDPRPLWQRVGSPQRWGLLPAFITAVVLLLAVSGAWLFTAAPWQGGVPAKPVALPAAPPTAMPAPTPTPAPAPGLPPGVTGFSVASGENTSAPGGSKGPPGPAGPDTYTPGALDTAQRQIISQATVSIEVKDVTAAIDQVRAIAEGLGGFVGQLSTSGGPKRQQSTVTVRVPQAEFFTALERIKALGKVRAESVGSQDVTEQFIDLQARLRSAQREEESLLSLLERAGTVSEILTIERELSRVRSEVERYQGQLNFLERRVELATITVTLFPPEAEATSPPSASLTIEVADISTSVAEVKALVSRVDGVLDQVFISMKGGKARANLSLRVFARDFGQVLSSLEAQGRVRSKELREGRAPGEAATAPAEKPDARLAVSFVERGPWLTGRRLALGASLGGVIVLGLLFYLTYRAGRRRGSLA